MAARTFQAAALLSLADEDRVRRTMGAGRALWLAGEGERAAALLESVLDLALERRSARTGTSVGATPWAEQARRLKTGTTGATAHGELRSRPAGARPCPGGMLAEVFSRERGRMRDDRLGARPRNAVCRHR